MPAPTTTASHPRPASVPAPPTTTTRDGSTDPGVGATLTGDADAAFVFPAWRGSVEPGAISGSLTADSMPGATVATSHAPQFRHLIAESDAPFPHPLDCF